MGIAELRRLRQLEEERQKPKGIVADPTLDKKMLQDVLSIKVRFRGPTVRRSAVSTITTGRTRRPGKNRRVLATDRQLARKKGVRQIPQLLEKTGAP